MATIETTLLTAEEYANLPDPGFPTELVDGEVVAVNMPRFMHGAVCRRVSSVLGDYVDRHKLGWVLSNDSGVVTKRDPDTVRGADVAYYSYSSVPKSPPPELYASNPPELVFEVKSQDDRWPAIQEKIAEYLTVGVEAVCVLDPEHESLSAYQPSRPVEILNAAAAFSLPEILPGFSGQVADFFA